VAETLGYTLVDTGAIYRTVALGAERAGISWQDADALSAFAERLASEQAIRFEPAPGGQRVLYRNEDVSLAIRTQHMGDGASQVSAVPGVRAALLAMQRSAGAVGGVVLEGRDIGTVVFPDAEAKFYLTASVEVRAKRRFDELVARGETPDLAAIEREIAERDLRDSTRAVAPLRQAEDAIIVDSSALDIPEVVARIVHHTRMVALRLSGRSNEELAP
jgi:cytidylate kinase